MPMTKPTVAAGRYRIDPGTTSVRFAIKEWFGLSTVHGTLTVREGEITVSEDPLRSTVHAAVDAASFSTGWRRRDRDVTSRRFLDVAEYPEMTFAGRSITPTGEGRATVTGIMTVRGVAREVDFDVTESRTGAGDLRLLARTRVDRTDFGVRRARGFVDRFLDIELDVTAVPTALHQPAE